MKRLLLLVALVGCGDNIDVRVPPDTRTFEEKLRDLDGVTVEKTPTNTSGFTYYVLHFTEPVDHDDPASATFQLEVSLLHGDVTAPMIVHTSGYADYYRDRRVELSYLLSANQVSIEHRFFAGSRPEPTDWSKLTIAQMAADEHDIIQKLRTIYPGAFITTGGSKGGMTAVFHRRFYPDDVDGTVPYVAPISFGAPDVRYNDFLAQVGTAECRTKVQALATEILQHRRPMIEAKATQQATDEGHLYTRVSLGAAAESAVVNLEWSFWQYYGVDECADVPSPAATDAAVWSFLDRVSGVKDSDDANIADFEAYYYQSDVQLGYPATNVPYLDAYITYGDDAYANIVPDVPQPYDGGAAMRDIDDWVQSEGDRLLFVYGQWDPWTGGAFTLGNATDSMIGIQREGTHNSSISFLDNSVRAAALAKLEAWTAIDVVNMDTAREKLRSEPLPTPKIPPALVRALAARHSR